MGTLNTAYSHTSVLWENWCVIGSSSQQQMEIGGAMAVWGRVRENVFKNNNKCSPFLKKKNLKAILNILLPGNSFQTTVCWHHRTSWSNRQLILYKEEGLFLTLLYLAARVIKVTNRYPPPPALPCICPNVHLHAILPSILFTSRFHWVNYLDVQGICFALLIFQYDIEMPVIWLMAAMVLRDMGDLED